MGCSASLILKESNPHYLRAVDLKLVNIPQFDELFGECEEPLERLVRLNNAFFASLDGFTRATEALLGKNKLLLSISRKYGVAVYTVEIDIIRIKNGNVTSVLSDELQKAGHGGWKLAYEQVAALKKPLVEAASEAKMEVSMSPDDQVTYTRRKGQAADEESYINFVATVDKFNRRLRDMRKLVLSESQCDVSLTSSVRELALSLRTAGMGLLATKEPFDVDFPCHGVGELPLLQQMSISALHSVVKAIRNVTAQMPLLSADLEGLVEKVSGFPNKAKEVLQEAGTDNLEMVKAVKIVLTNVSMVSHSPEIFERLVHVTKQASRDIVKGISIGRMPVVPEN